MPTFGSAFSGIGGFDLGLERAGWACRWQIEIDEYRRKILERHWPNVERRADIRTDTDGLERVDLIAAGFPCQPFSVAGRNRGEDDERNLWPETIRLIRQVGPQLALLENVPNLLSHQYFGTILGDLAEAGYDAEWFCVKASDFGASQRRDRLFIVAYTECAQLSRGRRARNVPSTSGADEEARLQRKRHGDSFKYGSNDVVAAKGSGHEARGSRLGAAPAHSGLEQSGLSLADAQNTDGRVGIKVLMREERLGGEDLEATARTFPPGPDDLDAWARVLAEVPSVEPALCRVANGVPDRTHRLAALGDSVVPQVVEWIGSRILRAHMESQP